jgi:hypothetical protein
MILFDPPPMPPQIANIHNSLYNAIENSKRQQWTITNYIILLYGAIFGLSKYFGNPTTNEKIVFSGLTLLAWLYASILLIFIQFNLMTYRRQLDRIYQRWLCEQEAKLIIERHWYPHFFRGGFFLFALVGVVVIGGALVVYSLWREPTASLFFVAYQ